MSDEGNKVDDVWASLQAEESEKNREYKKRVKEVAKRRGVNEDFDLSQFMANANGPSSSRDNMTNSAPSLAPTSSSSNKKSSSSSSSSSKSKDKDKDKDKEKDKDKDKKKDKVSSSLESSASLVSTLDSSSQQVVSIVPLVDISTLMPLISRDLVNFSHDDSAHRRKALTNIIDVLFTKNRVSDVQYNEFLSDHGKSIFRLFADSLEKCRELSVRLTFKLFEHSQDFTPILSYFIPALIQRLPTGLGYDEELKIFVHDIEKHDEFKRGKAVDRQDKVDSVTPGIVKVIEGSEEIRFLLCHTLHLLLHRIKELDAVTIIQPYFNEIIVFCQCHIRDPYSEVKVLNLENLILLAKTTDFELGMCFFSMALCRQIFPVLRHRHAKVRTAAVVALTACMTVPFREKCKAAGSDCIPELIGFKEDNVLSVAAFYKPDVSVNYMAEIVCDNSVAVKEKVVMMLNELLTEIPDRFDHSQRLVPYLLDLLTDPADSICQAALKVLQVCGKQYEEEHHDDIIDKRQYGVDGDSRINLDKKLPYPFLERPRIGLRLFSRGNSKRFIFALVNELTNWVSHTRIKSAKLLKIVIVLCEEHLTVEAHQLFPSYIKALVFAKDDGDKELHQILIEVFELVGRFMLPELYLHFILPRLRGDKDIVQFGVDAKTRTSVLQLLSALIDGSKPTEVAPFFEEIVSCVSNPLYIDPESVVIQSAAVDTIVTLLKSLEGKGKVAIESVFLATGRLKTLKVGMKSCFKFLLRILASNNEEYSAKAAVGLKLLAKLDESFVHGVEDLFLLYGKEVLLDLMNRDYDAILDPTWSANNIEHKLLCVLLECPYPVTLSYIDGGGSNSGSGGGGKIPILGQVFNVVCKWLREMASNNAFVIEFSRLLSSCMLPFYYSSFVSRTYQQYEHLVGTKAWSGKKWRSWMNSECKSGLLSIARPLEGIFKFFILDPNISRSAAVGVAMSSTDLARLRLASICFGATYIDIEQKTSDMFIKYCGEEEEEEDGQVVSNHLYTKAICNSFVGKLVESPGFLTLMTNCSMPFVNLANRLQVVEILASLFDSLSDVVGFDRVRCYSSNWDTIVNTSTGGKGKGAMTTAVLAEMAIVPSAAVNIRKNVSDSIRPFIDLLFALLNDSSDSVVRNVLGIFSSRAGNFIPKNYDDKGGVSYFRVVERLSKDLAFLAGSSGSAALFEEEGGQEELPMLAVVEYALRSLAVLDPVPFEAILRGTLLGSQAAAESSSSSSSPSKSTTSTLSTSVSPAVLQLVSGLIDHASFLQQVAPK